MPQFVLMLRDSGSFPEDISPEEIQAIIQKYGAWIQSMGGKGQKLRDGEGRIVVRERDRISVTDGPYAEAKEVLGGYFLVEADSYDDVVRRCEGSPHLDYGSIEIRQVEM
jgi:hypothetical protein